ncbi:hypothetical protein [Formosa haliotis]|uniref:hypothetical protein n=1 Tax=Formosa haliotis TaxID=1555194 RepID=UPI00114700EB|nr:hypothetical protein [Formosa haliotis]
MKKRYLIVILLLCTFQVWAQKVIYNPVHEGMNFSAELTKIELTEEETILHFFMKRGVSFIIPSITHIQDDSNQGDKMFIKKAVGLNIGESVLVDNPEGMIYKLYFPPLNKTITTIDYKEHDSGEANWYIKNINISNTTVAPKLEKQPIALADLPKSFFGSWHDKYGTLIALATPEFLLYEFKMYRYRDIYKTGDGTFLLHTSGGNIDILKHTQDSLTLRYDKMVILNRDQRNITMPEEVKGNWKHFMGVKKIRITDTYFYNDDTGIPNINEIENNRIITIGSSKSGDVFWFLLDNGKHFNAFKAEKNGSNYVLTPTGFPGAIYRKVKNIN